MKQVLTLCIIAFILSGCRTPTFESKEDIEGRLADFGLTARALHVLPSGTTYLGLAASGLKDISALRGMKLTSLSIHRNPELVDLEPLRGMPLKRLWIDDTAVSDLTPLSGMPIEQLYMINTKVEDIATLSGMPLVHLFTFGSPVRDLSPLQGAPLQMLSFTPHHVTNGIDIIRSMKSIHSISTRGAGSKLPAQEFWKNYDAERIQEKAEQIAGP